MILTCPECSTKYMSKDGTIGPNGRSVRCARCETVWFVPGVDPDALALEDNQAVLITPEPDPQQDLPFVPKTPSEATVGAHTLLRDKADAEKISKRRRIIRQIWALPILMLLAAAIVVFLKRQAIVETFPRTATIYQAFGIDVKANGLDVRGLTSQRLVVDGEPVLRVTGEVVNLTSKTISSPLIQLRLENRSGEPLADWFVEPGTIAAGDSVNIETDYPAPPIDSVELRYRFATDE
ncbi:MAG: MJ0042-type zinc finger domain-containing protein [Litorimonas sp.]